MEYYFCHQRRFFRAHLFHSPGAAERVLRHHHPLRLRPLIGSCGQVYQSHLLPEPGADQRRAPEELSATSPSGPALLPRFAAF